MGNRSWFLITVMLVVTMMLTPGRVGAATNGNRVIDGDFQSDELQLRDSRSTQTDVPGIWVAFLDNDTQASFEIVQGECKFGNKCVRYAKDAPGSRNIHLDQVIELEVGVSYRFTAWVKAEGGLNPVIRLATLNWANIMVVPTHATEEWTKVEFEFTANAQKIRFQWFAGARGEFRQGYSGRSFLDGVEVVPLKEKAEVSKGELNLRINPDETMYRINPMFFGANILYWVEDDKSIQDGRVANYIKDMQLRLLRFPGGTVADNYHWQTNTLDDPQDFPFVPHEEAPGKMNTDEFIALSREVGAEPLIVVNTSAWVRNGDIKGGAEEAAAWVKHTNIDNDYNVKYWAIGNETYHHILMGAEQYAKVVVEYARAMKAVDPTIKIGVNGRWDYLDVGVQDRVKPGSLAMLLEAEASHSDSDIERKEAFEELKAAHIEPNRRLGQPQWWPTVLDIAQDALDFAVIHWYFSPAEVGSRLETAVQELDRLIKSKLPDRDIPIALTEWNVTPAASGEMTQLHIGLAIAEASLRFIDGGVTMGSFWPLRLNGNDYRAIIGMDQKPRPAYHVFRMLSTTIEDNRIPVHQDDSSIYAFASVNEERSELTVYLVDRTRTGGRQVVVDTGSFVPATVTGEVFTGFTLESVQFNLSDMTAAMTRFENDWNLRINKDTYGVSFEGSNVNLSFVATDPKLRVSGSICTLDLPPNSLAVLRFVR